MNKVVNIEKCFEKFTDTFSPKIIGELNGQYIMVVKLVSYDEKLRIRL